MAQSHHDALLIPELLLELNCLLRLPISMLSRPPNCCAFWVLVSAFWIFCLCLCFQTVKCHFLVISVFASSNINPSSILLWTISIRLRAVKLDKKRGKLAFYKVPFCCTALIQVLSHKLCYLIFTVSPWIIVSLIFLDNREPFMSAYYMRGTVLRTLHILCQLGLFLQHSSEVDCFTDRNT